MSIRARQPTDQGIALEKSMFHTRWKFNIGALGITLLLAALYIRFWREKQSGQKYDPAAVAR